MRLTKNPIMRLYFNILIAFDFLTNALTLGDPRETISSVLGKKEIEGCIACKYFCKVLSVILRQESHCKKSMQPIGYGFKDNLSPMPKFRRRMSNSFVILLLVMAIYKDEIQQFIIRIV